MSEHAHWTDDELRTTVEERLGDGTEPQRVGRLIDALRSRGLPTRPYQSRRSIEDLRAHVAWYAAHGSVAQEELDELARRGQVAQRG
ncbi:MAG: hypothetical protein HYU66_24005 [Armatimonadetes bacterium]|nr:hypothetical protein [Armatimonadota bacterium]